MNTVRIRKMTALTALGLALGVAGPAFAEPKTPAPAKKPCVIRFEGPGAGQSLEYPDGSSFSVHGTDGKKHTYTCNDGRWIETVSLTGGTVTLRNLTILGTARTLQAVRLG